MNVVINQPCYLPWRGYFALIKLADVFVFYDDVQLPFGRSFQTRVQIKAESGKKWLSVPIKRSNRHGQSIIEAQIHEESDWRRKHYTMLRESLSMAPYWDVYDEMIREWYSKKWDNLADLTITTTLDIVSILGIKRRFFRSSELGIEGGKTERLVAICKELGATRYISPWGSVNYLEHELFEDVGIVVEYIDYDNSPYPQQFGEFDPFVSIVDLLANVGPNANSLVKAGTIPWRDMVKRRLEAQSEDHDESRSKSRGAYSCSWTLDYSKRD